jgi:hypothetical protein
MLSTRPIASKTFLEDVAAYAAFLESWFSPERWSSAEPVSPLRSGMITSAEIAYVLLRFGRFHTDDWEEWETRGFVALDTAISEAISQVKGLLRAEQRSSLAGTEQMESSENDDSLNGLTAILYGMGQTEPSPYRRYPLLYALAVHVFVNLDRPGTDIVIFCRYLNLIVSCSP